ncbi:MAG: family 10 glycosylhydrolase [Cyanobacteria bacterium P01_A01_bin.84]
MSNRPLNIAKSMFLWRHLFAILFSSSLLLPYLGNQPARAKLSQYCQFSKNNVQQKENLRQATFLKGSRKAKKRYQVLIRQHAQTLRNCRGRNWPQVQAIWLRLYPCDLKPGALAQVMDRVVNNGYNHVYVETFYDGQVLLPQTNNNTVWSSVVRGRGLANLDLLAQAIQKGRERGLKVYSWMYTTNFGYSYAQRRDRERAIARNGKGQTSLYLKTKGSEVFIDPYNMDAKRDYYRMVLEVMRRRPDGILFDYIRYPRQTGSNSISTKVTDLWIYSDATQRALFSRAQNSKGLDLIRQFLRKGYVTAADISNADRKYPREGEPMWQGRIPRNTKAILSPSARQPLLQWDLWQLSVAHSMQGIVDFLNLATYPAKQQGIPAGAVFFPGGNRRVGRGFDSRLQPWDRFPNSLQWHPMAYANCGNTRCILKQIQRVLKTSKSGTQIIPALAGTWGRSVSNRPSLEQQMRSLRQYSSRIRGVSHFAYSWQYPQHDNARKFCRLR